MFGEHNRKQQSETKKNNSDDLNHDFATENFYLKKEVEGLKSRLQRSETQVDQLMASTQEQTKQLFLTQLPSSQSFWQRLWKK